MKLFKNLLKEKTFVFGFFTFIIVILFAVIGRMFVDPVTYDNSVAGTYTPPSSLALLGTDHIGRSVLPMLIMGLGSSLYVGLLAGVIATFVGTLLGVYAGFIGGVLDDIINMVTNLFMVIPIFVVLLLISSAIEDGRSLTLVAVIIGLTAWTWTCRSVRAQVSSLRTGDHISLARLNGDSTFKILFVHVLPYLFSYIFMVFIIQLATGILMEASISMIGLGPVEGVSLGIILNEANANFALIDGAWWAFFPAAFLTTILVFALYTLNTSMEGVFNPRLRKE
ncbi:ABC transporter permease [Chitinivibrio alkaliphilus]|uniref:ABC-type dipeptide/oligopeptide/nickel transport system, permease component n=1 Tax=Chitinivibrio alkaliphilus ACht1 TaxID=1313304 RepID=U7D6M5_9BACT|nr:ABC transporter permease [Chitinivibrio alkaliphilus]ERP32169.1 ABC-type dipeptide/oligopeptide/nickel transport system, permease component [Chitinivibrio alkaliphilus ACht1]